MNPGGAPHTYFFRHSAGRLQQLAAACLLFAGLLPEASAGLVDFNRDIRPLLSNHCFACHGPDAQERKGGKRGEGLRLDTEEGARADLGGYRALVPGQPEQSELFLRMITEDEDDLMPPRNSGKKLESAEIALLRQWIEEGAEYATHWSYVKPQRPPLAKVTQRSWPRNGIDYFVLARLEQEGLEPAPRAEEASLFRRVALDLTGLPPALNELDQALGDRAPGAYERWIDRLLEKPAFGEHWARLWLDHARYADSAGYADDPPRTIWAFRDYVIRSFNANKPFDQFTIEQLAGDLLPEATEEQRIATAFHRNTLTNNEGGTSDEEFRNVAVVDRVNTTLAVWMGTTMACAQCHDHKYDPISQEDYFKLFAILNNTEDADRGDEAPVHKLFTEDQKRQRAEWQDDIDRLKRAVSTVTPELAAAQRAWETNFTSDVLWKTIKPSVRQSQAGAAMTLEDDDSVRVARGGKTDIYTLEVPLAGQEHLSALRLETLPDERPPGGGVGHAAGNFVITGIRAALTPPGGAPVPARYLRVEKPGQETVLSLAEVQVIQGTRNIAQQGEASQSSTVREAKAERAVDGKTAGDAKSNSVTETEPSSDPWWELDFKSTQPVDRLVLWNRTDEGWSENLRGARVTLLNEERAVVWEGGIENSPQPRWEISLSGSREVRFRSAHASQARPGFEASHVLNAASGGDKGWSIGTEIGKAHSLTLIPEAPLEVAPGARLTLGIEQLSKFEYATVGRLRLASAADARAFEFARTPPALLARLLRAFGDAVGSAALNEAEQKEITNHYLTVAPLLEPERTLLASRQKQLEEQRPYTTVPVMRELAGEKRRKTHVQLRGNFLQLGAEISPGLPPAFHPAPESGTTDRLTLARWLMNPDNPLTARVLVNHFWESIFGVGLVRTSEEFGAQGELPSHPELLDWLSTELLEQGWNIKGLLKTMVTSAAYQQSSRVSPELLALDPENRLLARGPRFRLSAEMIRDQAMFVSGLLAEKMYGPPVKPPQPRMGVSAAFGSGIDWETSAGADRYRRGLYTTWRRSNPYPSMATFDAPNREVCTVRRERSNTPLQALVTLNDPVYVEAAQNLARRLVSAEESAAARVRHGFRLSIARPPSEPELDSLLRLLERTQARFSDEPEKARQVAGISSDGPLEGTDPVELAAWTMVANVLLNLDELLMKP